MIVFYRELFTVKILFMYINKEKCLTAICIFPMYIHNFRTELMKRCLISIFKFKIHDLCS